MLVPKNSLFFILAKNHFVPRRLNVHKPVGFSNRQRLAWSMYFHLKYAKKRKRRSNNKFVVNETKDENMNNTNEKSQVNQVKVKPANNMNFLLSKGHFRAIEECVKSRNFNLLAARTGMNPWTVKLLSLQMKTKLFCPLNQKFTIGDKIFSISYYKKFGPKKYRELSEFCALPPLKSLSDVMNKVPFLPGVNQQVFDNLKTSTMKLDEIDKYCSVIFHEIPLVMEENESETNDKDYSLTEDEDLVEQNPQDDKPKGDNVVLIMLRGLNRDWRQPIAFEVTKGKIKGFDLAVLLRKVIVQSLNAGFRVIAVVFNKKESYAEALSLLNSESLFPVIDDDKASLVAKHIDIRSKSTSQDSYPEAPKKIELGQLKFGRKSDPIWNTGYVLNLGSHEISLLYNPANLLRIIRNKWLTYDISFTENGKVKQASWNHIIKLHAADEGNEETKFCPKLTSRHVFVSEIDKGSTRCCTQIFSQRVSSAMRRLATLGVCRLDNSATDTADLLLLFDKLFDSVNGTNKIPQKGKTLRSSVFAGSPHRDFWRSITPILASMSFLTPFKEESEVFNLWLATLGSLHRLCDRLIVHKGLSSLPLGHLNCDPIETFIRCGLKLGAYSVRPTYDMFRDSFKTLLFCGDDLDSDVFDYQIHQLDSLRNYIFDEVP